MASGGRHVKINREILFPPHHPQKPDQLHGEEETIKAPHSLPDGCWTKKERQAGENGLQGGQRSLYKK